MNELFETLRECLKGLRLWVTVMPWEQAIRIRLGKRVELLKAGVHLKLPLLDVVYLQSVRMRICPLGRQTISALDGSAITVMGAVGYSISDIELLYTRLHHGEDTITNMVMAAIADRIAHAARARECTPQNICEGVRLDLSQFGIAELNVRITECVMARPHRLLGESCYYGWGDRLQTNSVHERRAKS